MPTRPRSRSSRPISATAASPCPPATSASTWSRTTRPAPSTSRKALGVETIYVPYLTPEQRPATGAAYLAFGKRLQEASRPYRDAGLGFGWHNHAFEFEQARRRRRPPGRDLRGRPRPRMGGRPRVGHQGRRRSPRVDQDLRQAPDRRPPQGHRPRRRQPRRGRLGRPRPRHRRLEGAQGGAGEHPGQVFRHGARQPEGPGAFRLALDRDRAGALRDGVSQCRFAPFRKVNARTIIVICQLLSYLRTRAQMRPEIE